MCNLRIPLASPPVQPKDPNASPCSTLDTLPKCPPFLKSNQATSNKLKPPAEDSGKLGRKEAAKVSCTMSTSATSDSTLGKFDRKVEVKRFTKTSDTCNPKDKLTRSLCRPESTTYSISTKSVTQQSHTQRKLRMATYGRKKDSPKTCKISPEGMIPYPIPIEAKKRCSWITSQSDATLIAYHDEEWGVPVHDDRKLFELISLGGIQADIPWSTIIIKRNLYRFVG
eukprot:c13938_g1_i1 orf=668-1345(-)